MRINVDEPNSWPREVRKACVELARRATDDPESISDLNLQVEEEDAFRRLLSGHHVTAYHVSRLLPHEADAIRRDGLRRLTEDLVRDRIAAAEQNGFLAHDEALKFNAAHVFAAGEEENRENRVCFFLSDATLRDRARGLAPLMREWGGEAISMATPGVELRSRLRELGSPALVVAGLELESSWRVHFSSPELQQVFVGRWLDLDAYDATVHYRDDVPGSQIDAVWVPGDSEYDQYDRLPRE